MKRRCTVSLLLLAAALCGGATDARAELSERTSRLSNPRWTLDAALPAGVLVELNGQRYRARLGTHEPGDMVALGAPPLARMFPERGDAAGSDLPDLPRPAGSARLLSAQIAVKTSPASPAPAVVAYRVDATPAQAAGSYQRELRALGFRGQQISAASSGDTLTFSCARDSSEFVVRVFAGASGTVIAAVRLPAMDAAASGKESFHRVD